MLDRNLWGYVDGTTMVDPGAEEKLHLKFKRKSQKALTAIMPSISTPYCTHCSVVHDSGRGMGSMERGL